MKIGLIQVDGKMENLALMKLSQWHKQRGDEVTLIDISSHTFDRIYASKVFVGGSGYDLKSELPPEIEVQVPDYDLFKKDHSIGFSSRGCIRDCGFCIVREKEGYLKETPLNWIRHVKILLLDNNFLATEYEEKLQYFIDNKMKVCFNQGLDIRLINEKSAKLLSRTKYYDFKFRKRRLYFAFDDPKLESIVKEKVAMLKQAGIPSKHLMFYVLVGYNTTFEQDYHRFKVLDQLGCLPFIMLYNNSRIPLLRDFARWVNKRYYCIMDWENYKKKEPKK